MRIIARMLLASVLAVGAGSLAGCGDSCPSQFSGYCSTEGLTCTASGLTCTCTTGDWSCNETNYPPVRDLSAAVHDLSMPDLAPQSD